MPEKSLLEKALGFGSRRPINNEITDEHIELSLAWQRGEVRLTQVTRALGLSRSNSPTAYRILALSLAEHIRRQEEDRHA